MKSTKVNTSVTECYNSTNYWHKST